METAISQDLDAVVGAFIDRAASIGHDHVEEVLAAQFDAGLAWPQFDPGIGGLGLDDQQRAEVTRRLEAAGIPKTRADFVAFHQVSQLLHDVASEESKDLHLLRIFTGAEHWCQLFSEPSAGSDLAGVATRAVRDGGDWLVSGQKIWTSGATHADFALLLARTDPDLPKHQGLTMFVLPMSADGVDVRPLRQADGGARFSEVFLDSVRISDSDRLGEVGGGWGLSMKVLGTERTGASDIFMRPIADLLEHYKARRTGDTGSLRHRVAQIWVEAAVVALNKERVLNSTDPAELAALRAISKVQASEHAQRYAEVLAEVVGPEVLVSADYEAVFAADASPEATQITNVGTMSPTRFLIRTRAMSIEGGTNEIQRNITGERVLGLAAEVRVDKSVPWKQVPRG